MRAAIAAGVPEAPDHGGRVACWALAATAAPWPASQRSWLAGTPTRGGHAPAGSYCSAPLSLGQQCGGALGFSAFNCTNGRSCVDATWAGCSCGAGAACARSSKHCHKCAPSGAPTSSYLTLPEASAAALASTPASVCPAAAANGSTAYDWGCVLRASMRFYDAQRSGKLPPSVDIRWRGDTQLKDAAPNGASLVGGFYDAGGGR
jgi:hypothetical protein